MITNATSKYLELIFSDADLLGVDFSLWDTGISVYVLADHVPSPIRGKRALLAVRFRGVRKFDWSFQHHTFDKFPLKTSENQHLNWNIYRISMTQGDLNEVTLSGSEQFPVLRIEFEDVHIEEVAHAMFLDVNPGGLRQGQGLARPSIERLHALIKGM